MDLKEIKELLKSFDKSDLDKLKLKNGDFEIVLQKNGIKNIQPSVPAPEYSVATQPQSIESKQEVVQDKSVNEKSDNSIYIKSPMVGTFYQSPSPGSAAFVQVGDSVKAGNTIAIIEAMKIMNELEAEFDCKILDILVSDGEPVEFDQPLFLVEKL